MNIDKIKKDIEKAKLSYINYSSLLEEIWVYHPANPDFVNPIKIYEDLKSKLLELEQEISSLEREINSLN
jgi:hypothetical protein